MLASAWQQVVESSTVTSLRRPPFLLSSHPFPCIAGTGTHNTTRAEPSAACMHACIRMLEASEGHLVAHIHQLPVRRIVADPPHGKYLTHRIG